jgi:hypothetical protein
MSKLSSLTSMPDPKDHGETQLSSDSSGSLGEALAKFDFGHTDLGAQAPEYSDAHAALASMSVDDALDYAISQIGPADHLDGGCLDIPPDTSHDS